LKIEIVEIESVGTFTVYAYNSLEGQTDGSPCISADNKDICERFEAGEKMVATNDFPLGAEIFLGELGKFTVVDRMNSRYSRTIDIFMGYDVDEAKEFGKKKLSVFTQK
jgi:3D (Asp-Asp-Asp) domain-containing protein